MRIADHAGDHDEEHSNCENDQQCKIAFLNLNLIFSSYANYDLRYPEDLKISQKNAKGSLRIPAPLSRLVDL